MLLRATENALASALGPRAFNSRRHGEDVPAN